MKKTQTFSFLIAALFLQACFVVFYVGSERTFYYWDLSMYHALARDLLAQPNGGAMWAHFEESFQRNYNDLYALPALLGMRFFGASRVVYILSNFLSYFLFFEAGLAFLLCRIFGWRWQTALGLAPLLCFAVPHLWTPLFEGFPDISSLACMVFAVALALDPERSAKKALFTGLLLGLAIVLRRHFAYAVVAFFIASAGEAFFAKRPLFKTSCHAVLTGLALVALVCFMEPDYVKTVMTTSFRDLYKSYEEPFSVFALYALASFGLMGTAIAFAGYAWAFKARPALRSPLFFMTLFGVVWFLIWGLGPSQLGPHHLIPVLPLFYLAGTAALLAMIWETRWRNAGIAALGALFFAQALWGLVLAPSHVFTAEQALPAFFSEPHPPLRRADFDAMIDLARDLLDKTGPNDKIVVVGSSAILNQDLLRAVYTDELGETAILSRFLWAPEIDREQPPPFDMIAGGTVFIVPEPTQYHLNPEGQTVVTALAKQFPPEGARAPLFERDQKIYRLADGVVVSLWRRTKDWTPEALHAALSLARDSAGGNQRWVVAAPALFSNMQTDPIGQTNAMLPFTPDHAESELFFDVPLEKGLYRFAAELLASPACAQPQFELRLQSPDGRLVKTEDFAPSNVPASLQQVFSTANDQASALYFSLRIKTQPQASCGLYLGALRLEKHKD